MIIPGCLYAEGTGKNEVTILWGSMYGMTEKVVNYVESILQREGIKYNKLKMPLATKVKWLQPCLGPQV